MRGSIPERDLMEKINFGSRDNARRPIAWTSGKNFGFGTGKPWTTLHSRGAEVNAERDAASEKSVRKFYKALLRFRKQSSAVRYGSFADRTEGQDGCFVYLREYGEEQVLVVCNFETENDVCPPSGEYRLVLSNYGHADRPTGGRYMPFETAVFVRK